MRHSTSFSEEVLMQSFADTMGRTSVRSSRCAAVSTLCGPSEEEEVSGQFGFLVDDESDASEDSEVFDEELEDEDRESGVRSSTDSELSDEDKILYELHHRHVEKVQEELNQRRGSLIARGSWLQYLWCRLVEFKAFVARRKGEPWIRSNLANIAFGGLILLNAIFIGIETDWNRPGSSDISQTVWLSVESIFLVFFIIELLLRVQADRHLVFNDAWNIMDLILILLGISDAWLVPLLYPNTNDSNDLRTFSVIRLFRLVRIARVLRVLRLLRFVKELLTLVRGILDAVKALVWAFLLIAIVLYVSAVFTTQIIRMEFDPTNQGQMPGAIKRWFGSVGSSLLTLLSVMTLEDYPEIVRLTAFEGKVWLLCFFVPFICCTNFALLNVVTAVIVERVFRNFQEERTRETKKALRGRKVAMRKIYKLFERLQDSEGMISIKEFSCHLQRDVMKQFHELGIAKHDIDGLLLCVDMDNQGKLSMAEFVQGCLRMQGVAASKDLLRFQYDVHRTQKALDIKKLVRQLAWASRCLAIDIEHPSWAHERNFLEMRGGRAKTLNDSTETMKNLESLATQNRAIMSPPLGQRSERRTATSPAAMHANAAAIQAPEKYESSETKSSTTTSTPQATGSTGASVAPLPVEGRARSSETEADMADYDSEFEAALQPQDRVMLEEVIDGQKQLHQLLEVLGKEMRGLRQAVDQFGAAPPPLNQKNGQPAAAAPRQSTAMVLPVTSITRASDRPARRSSAPTKESDVEPQASDGEVAQQTSRRSLRPPNEGKAEPKRNSISVVAKNSAASLATRLSWSAGTNSKRDTEPRNEHRNSVGGKQDKEKRHSILPHADVTSSGTVRRSRLVVRRPTAEQDDVEETRISNGLVAAMHNIKQKRKKKAEAEKKAHRDSSEQASDDQAAKRDDSPRQRSSDKKDDDFDSGDKDEFMFSLRSPLTAKRDGEARLGSKTHEGEASRQMSRLGPGPSPVPSPSPSATPHSPSGVNSANTAVNMANLALPGLTGLQSQESGDSKGSPVSSVGSEQGKQQRPKPKSPRALAVRRAQEDQPNSGSRGSKSVERLSMLGSSARRAWGGGT